MTQEALKKMYQLLLTEPHAPTVCAQLEGIAREALAQTQEPVGHRDGFWCVDLTCKKCYSADFRFKHPQPQRTWVGLTDEERIEIHHQALNRFQAVQMTEAKLKQKNGYAEEKNT